MSPEGSSVTFRRPAADVRLRAIQNFARKLQKEVARGAAFDCLITGDAELRRLNREFRGKDYPTDVLSFPVGQASGLPYLGDLAISLQRARNQAREYGHGTEDEIRILMLHGLLHLIGMDHERDRGEMARAESRWRARLGLPDGLIERVSA
jgi:probable rRNA maturation factor